MTAVCLPNYVLQSCVLFLSSSFVSLPKGVCAGLELCVCFPSNDKDSENVCFVGRGPNLFNTATQMICILLHDCFARYW